MEFCNCKDWDSVKENNPFEFNDKYGWIIGWIELTDEVSHTKIHRYGISISFCPMCGKKLNCKKG